MNFSLLESEILPPPLACELQHFLARLDGVRPSGAGYMARCPAHEDRNPSLSIQAGQDGRVLFNCHAGCDSNTVLARLELRWADLRPPTRDKKQIGERAVTAQEIAAWPSTRALYEYQDETGKSLFLVVRMQKAGKKTFAQYRSLGGQLWRKGLDGMQPRLYRSPDLAGARMRRERVFVVEGEKDVETLRGLGLVATCNPGGAGKWRVSFSEALQGLQVAVLPDNDEVGRKHALEVAQSLLGRAEGVKVLELPGLPSKGDVTDWVEQGGTRIELESLIESLPVWRNTRSQLAPASEAQLHLTELGNSQRLVKRWGAELRFCHPWQRWLVWNGCRWVTDSTGDAIRKAKETVRSIYSEAAQLTDDRQRQETVAHGRRSETQARLRAMLGCAESEPGIPVLPDQLDADEWLLNCQNGTLDLRNGQLRPHRREDLLTKMVPVEFHPEASCPNWDAFLLRSMGGQLELVSFLQRAVGYALTGETREHCLFFLHGSGRNGKSTFLETLYGMLGDYSQKADFSTFLEKKNDSIRNDLARLKGCRFLSASEAAEDRKFAEALVKDVTGGETITARHLYGEYFDFRPSFKLFLSANHKPTIRGLDEGIWSRIRLVPFEVFLPPGERDARLPEKLRAEWPGILAWAVRGCLEWQSLGLRQPRAVDNATQRYREEMDPLLGFLATHCTFEAESRAPAGLLYVAYRGWCLESGEEPLSQKAFGTCLSERGLRRYRGRFEGAVVWLWQGVKLC